MSMGGGGGGGMSSMFSQIGSTVGASANYFITRTAQRRAAEHESAAQNQANALYTDLYNQTNDAYKPYQDIGKGGQSAYDQLLATYGIGPGGAKMEGGADYSGFYNAPDYQFALQQGQKQLDATAAAKGRLYSGAQQKASQQYGQDYATQYLGNYRTGLGNTAQLGLNTGMQAENALTNYRAGYGNQLGGGYINLGDIQAARDMGAATAHRQWYQDMNDIWGQGAQSSGKSSGGNALGGFGGFGGSGGSGQTGGPASNASMYNYSNFGGFGGG